MDAEGRGPSPYEHPEGQLVALVALGSRQQGRATDSLPDEARIGNDIARDLDLEGRLASGEPLHSIVRRADADQAAASQTRPLLLAPTSEIVVQGE